MTNKLDLREVVVNLTARGTNGSNVIEVVDAAMDMTVSMKAHWGSMTWLDLLLAPTHQKRRRWTPVPMVVPS